MKYCKRKTILWLTGSIQLAMCGIVAMEHLGISFPYLRPVIGFVFISLVPGMLTLCALKFRAQSMTELLVYSSGLSLSFAMLLALFANIVYPVIGIKQPISLMPLLATMTVVSLLLLAASLKRPMDEVLVSEEPRISQLHLSYGLLLAMLPVASFFGTHMVNISGNSILLQVLLLIISIIPITAAFGKLPSDVYHFATYNIALAMIFHISLIGPGLNGFDIHEEYYTARLVLDSSYWNPNLAHFYNSVLSVQLLAPLYSIICRMKLEEVFKVIYPFLLAEVPLLVYLTAERKSDRRTAFLAAFFLISLVGFFVEMVYILKQQIAHIFIALLAHLMIDGSKASSGTRVMTLTFFVTLVLSHYLASLVLLAVFASSWLGRLLWKMLQQRSDLRSPKTELTPCSNRVITPALLLIGTVLWLSWYIYNSSSIVFAQGVLRIDLLLRTVVYFLDVAGTPFFTLGFSSARTPLREVTRILYLVFTVLIAVGLLRALLYRQEGRGVGRNDEYLFCSLVSFVLSIAVWLTPWVTASINPNRMFQLTTIFLALYCAQGAVDTQRLLLKTWHRLRTGILRFDACQALRPFSVAVAMSLLLNAQFFMQIASDNPTSIALSQNVIRFGDDVSKVDFYTQYVTAEEIFSARFLSRFMVKHAAVFGFYSDIRIHALVSSGLLHKDRVHALGRTGTELVNEGGALSYVYLRYINTVYKLGTATFDPLTRKPSIFDLKEVRLLDKANKVYANGGSEILVVVSTWQKAQ